MRHDAIALAAAFALQGAAVAAVPAHETWIRAHGTPVTVAVEPVDPYDPLRGYALTFRYNGADERLPGYDGGAADGAAAYVVLAAPHSPGERWQPRRIQRDLPRGERALHVRYRRWCAAGLPSSRYRCTALVVQPSAWYVDERDRFALAAALREGRAVAELRVAPDGEASLMRLKAAPSAGTMGPRG
ncbi:MAG TPA: GDYXXLXY domain-containing protein [Candidatus Elarobacter sp.]|nr:GDYXXLXY domain-containing protein [Candidatus Elarobacter sp.]